VSTLSVANARLNVLNNFYTYAYLRSNGSPYYIGKGRGNRAWACHKRCAVQRPRDKSCIIILKQNLSEVDAFRHEEYLIAVLGRKDLGTGVLRNRTSGGEGSSGFAKDILDKIRAARHKQPCPRTGLTHSEDTKALYRKQRKQYEYTFYGPGGEVVKGLSPTEMCEIHPELRRSNLIAVARGARDICQGWTASRIKV
jgi:hypothetical protein